MDSKWQVYRGVRAQVTALWLGIAILLTAVGVGISGSIGNYHTIDEWGMSTLAIWGFFEAVTIPADIVCIRDIYKG